MNALQKAIKIKTGDHLCTKKKPLWRSQSCTLNIILQPTREILNPKAILGLYSRFNVYSVVLFLNYDGYHVTGFTKRLQKNNKKVKKAIKKVVPCLSQGCVQPLLQ